jgi:hypothetical protein
VAVVSHAIHVASVPGGLELEPHLEGAQDGADDTDLQSSNPALLDAAHCGRARPYLLGDVLLTPSLSHAHSPHSGAESEVIVHVAIVGEVT